MLLLISCLTHFLKLKQNVIKKDHEYLKNYKRNYITSSIGTRNTKIRIENGGEPVVEWKASWK